jgi:ribosomal protein L40E
MKCDQCGIENPRQSKFCRNCGSSLGAHLQCSQCGAQNPGDSLYCTECGEKIIRDQKLTKGTQRKCKNCGHLNELDALFCVSCGEEIIKVPKQNMRRKSTAPSYKTIALVIGTVFLLGFAIKLGINFSKEKNPSTLTASSPPPAASLIKVDEAKVIAVAKNFKCACGGCGELPLATCECDMPKGAEEEKNFIREKLAEGVTVEQVIELLDRKYGHRV